ncbi:SBBP repeat-containing protein [Botrimarina mediterranea]|uniref:Beta-propeller repeat protein n=1 Tax=Botrimarina mediterranea TaxID=2528022 RepID=A0A518K3B5_9BACT|nr:SBBP repeat-containing protein [Botrimarina mediterranea]QDV72296.1 Beta-propeller repeat protein [Botrimarina mediterranea]
MTYYYSSLAFLFVASSAFSQSSEWMRPLGTNTDDFSYGIAIDSDGNVFVTGNTKGDFDGFAGPSDKAFVARYNSSGELLWVDQLGASARYFGKDIAVGPNGGVYIVGNSFDSTLPEYAGSSDAFVMQYDSDGNRGWSRAIGSSSGDSAEAIAIDGLGSLYMVGNKNGDGFIAKLGLTGDLLWENQFNKYSDYQPETFYEVATTNEGGVVAAGNAQDDFSAATQPFLVKYSSAGDVEWEKRLGDDGYAELGTITGMAASLSGDFYVTGTDYGTLDVRTGEYVGGTAFLSKYSSDGRIEWMHPLDDLPAAIETDQNGGLLVTGVSLIPRPYSSYVTDAFVSLYDEAGDLIWKKVLSTTVGDYTADLATNGRGLVYVAGTLNGGIGRDRTRDSNAFVAKTVVPTTVPEPGFGVILITLSTITLLVARRTIRV